MDIVLTIHTIEPNLFKLFNFNFACYVDFDGKKKQQQRYDHSKQITLCHIVFFILFFFFWGGGAGYFVPIPEYLLLATMRIFTNFRVKLFSKKKLDAL